MAKDLEIRPENMDDIYSKENLEFMCQYKIRSAVLRALKEKFDVKEMLIISEKKTDKKDEGTGA
jgi:hypothetical protein